MAKRDFPYVYDALRLIQGRIDQDEDYEGQAQWPVATQVQECQAAYMELWSITSNQDEDWGVSRDTTKTIAVGDSELTLPDDLRVLRSVQELDAQGQLVNPIPESTYEGMRRTDQFAYVFEIKDNTLFFPNAAKKAYDNLLIVYEAEPTPIFHGAAQAGSSTTIQFAAHESIEDDIYNGATCYIYDGPGEGETQTITDYRGYDRQATVAAWAVSGGPNNTSFYTVRPKLPRQAMDAFTWMVADRLLTITEGESFTGYSHRIKKAIELFEEHLKKLRRSGPERVRDDEQRRRVDILRGRRYGRSA